MNISVVLPRALPPVNFNAWMETCVELASLLAAPPPGGRDQRLAGPDATEPGSGLIALVGPAGSGKTFTLTAFARAPMVPNRRAGLRRPGQPRDPVTTLDLVDAVDSAGLRRLDDELAFDGQRVIAIRPGLLEDVERLHPDVRVVRIRPMAPRDIRTLLEARRTGFGLPEDAITPRALLALERFSAGRPGVLDALYLRTMQIARIAGTPQIAEEHVEQANKSLSVDATAHQMVPPPQRAVAVPAFRSPDDPAVLAGSEVAGAGAQGAIASKPSTETSPPAAPGPAAAEGHDGGETMCPTGAVISRNGLATTGQASSAWDVLLRPTAPEVIARAKRAKLMRACRDLALAALAIAALVWVLDTGALGRVRAFGEASALRLDRYAAALDLPRAASLARQTAVRLRPAATGIDVAPLILTIPAIETTTMMAAGPGGDGAIRMVLPNLTLNLRPEAAAPDALRPPITGDDPDGAAARPADPAAAARLLAVAKVLLQIGQIADAREMFNAAARRGNADTAPLSMAGAPDGATAAHAALALPDRGGRHGTPRSSRP